MSGYDPTPGGGAPVPGWYPDPAGSTLQRWWDGTAWTATTQPDPADRYTGPGTAAAYPASQYPAAAYAATPSSAGQYGTYPAAAPAASVAVIKNTQATAGLVLGIVAMVVDPLGVPAILGIIFSGLGLSRAGQLQRFGYAPVGRTKAVWGLVLSILGLLGTATVKLWAF